MAELDLIDIWKKDTASLRNAEINVDEAIGKKSTTVLAKIRFILQIEFWLNNAITPACAILYFIEVNKAAGIFTGLAFLIYFAYYLFLIRSINRFDYSEDVKHSLTKVYKYLRFYLLHYKVVIWVTYLLVFWGGVIYGYYMASTGQEMDMPPNVPKIDFTGIHLYVLLTLIVLIPILFASLLHWLVNLIYGRKIKKLKRIIDDLS